MASPLDCPTTLPDPRALTLPLNGRDNRSFQSCCSAMALCELYPDQSPCVFVFHASRFDAMLVAIFLKSCGENRALYLISNVSERHYSATPKWWSAR